MLTQSVVLWDVDGTLLVGGPAGRDVFDLALERVLGRSVVGHGVAMSGKTDPQIAREIMGWAGVPAADCDGHLAATLTYLEAALAQLHDRLPAEGRVLPGVPQLLARLHEAGVTQALLTGNIRPNAVVKVTAFGLDRWLDLDLGAYGSDHHDRRELVPLVLARLAAPAERVCADRVWVVGDTPLDLACAQAAGVRCLLVATGGYGVDELTGLGADKVLPDLADTDRVATLLAG